MSSICNTISSTRTKRTIRTQSLNTLPNDLIERARIELKREKKRKQRNDVNCKYERLNTVNSNTTVGDSLMSTTIESDSWMEMANWKGNDTYRKGGYSFKRNIVDYSKSSRENLYIISKQLNSILNKVGSNSNNSNNSNNNQTKNKRIIIKGISFHKN